MNKIFLGMAAQAFVTSFLIYLNMINIDHVIGQQFIAGSIFIICSLFIKE